MGEFSIKGFIFIACPGCLFSLYGFFLRHRNYGKKTDALGGSPDMKLPPERLSTVGETTREVTVAAVGDIMVHQTQYVRAYDPGRLLLIRVSYAGADLVVGNHTSWDNILIISYLCFNAPTIASDCERRDSICCARPTTTAWIKVNRVSTELLRSWSRRG